VIIVIIRQAKQENEGITPQDEQNPHFP